jgi:hypothetical protein
MKLMSAEKNYLSVRIDGRDVKVMCEALNRLLAKLEEDGLEEANDKALHDDGFEMLNFMETHQGKVT